MAKLKLGNASRTILQFGAVKAPVALFKTTKEPKDAAASWDTAGPHGGTLHRQQKPVDKPVAEEESADPLAVEEPERSPLATAILGAPARSSDGDAGGLREYLAGGNDGPGGQDASADYAAPEAEYRNVLVEAGSGEEVEPEAVRRGIRLDPLHKDGDPLFVDLTPHLAKIEADTKLEVMKVVSFVRVEKVPRARVIGSYYLAADGDDALAVATLYRALRRMHRVAVVKWTKRTRQSAGVVAPVNVRGKDVLVVLELAWEAHWIDPTPRVLTHLAAEVPDAYVDAACELIKAMADSVDSLDELEDDAVAARRDLRAYVEEHRKAPAAPEGEKIETPDDFLAALQAGTAG